MFHFAGVKLLNLCLQSTITLKILRNTSLILQHQILFSTNMLLDDLYPIQAQVNCWPTNA
jgi:hypothetical protein